MFCVAIRLRREGLRDRRRKRGSVPAAGLWQGWRLGGLVLGLAALACLLTPGLALAETMVIQGRPLEISLPQGFCRLEPSAPREEGLAQSIVRREGAGERTLLVFVDCHALEAWRAGGPAQFDRIGWLGQPDTGGSVERPRPSKEYLDDIREDMPRHSAAEILAAAADTPALLVESARYVIYGRASAGDAPRMRAGALVSIGSVALEFALVQAPGPSPDDNALRLAEAAGQIAETVGEFFVVNDVFDDADALTESPVGEGGYVMAAMAAALTLGSFFGIRSMWPLLRAPRRRSWPLQPPSL